jgi:hypothetical protein
MKKKYIMMSMIIQGPKQPRNDIDIYFQLLVEELLTLWRNGVTYYDAYGEQIFKLHALLLHTIQDMPALGNTPGQKTRGDLGCVTCMDWTASTYLPNSRKTVYLRHRRYLRKYHPYRKMRTEFDGTHEKGVGPRPYLGEEVHSMATKIVVVLGKGHGSSSKQTPMHQVFKKKSVF